MEKRKKFGVDYGLYEASVARTESTIKLKNINEKIEFVQGLTADDEIYLEFGSGADKFALSCLKKGAKVFRIPTTVFKKWRNGADKSNDAALLLELAENTPELFYEAQAKDMAVLEIGLLLQKYYVIQDDIRKKAEQRLFLVASDDLLVKGEPIADMEKTLRKEIAEHPMFAGAKKEEERIYREIDKLVRNTPIFKEVFAPIKGVGGVIAGRIIYGIQDIRRFKSEAHLKNYAGYGFNKAGEIQKRRKGEIASWNKFLKQGVYLFTDQVNRRADSQPWHDMLTRRKEYEREKFPEPVVKKVGGENKKFFTNGHIHNKAMHYVGQKFLEHVWRQWRRFEEVNA